MTIVYLDGQFVGKSEAKVSVDDRGFLLGDGVYEVIPFYSGVPFGLDRHLERLRRGLGWIRIAFDVPSLVTICHDLLEKNGLKETDRSLVYLQVTRGAAARTHYFPATTVVPTVYAYAAPWNR
ncbi:MAG: aminotransferase class IV, partial [Dehalococcoidia bacterium]